MADKGVFIVYTAMFIKFLAHCKDSAKSCIYIHKITKGHIYNVDETDLHKRYSSNYDDFKGGCKVKHKTA